MSICRSATCVFRRRVLSAASSSTANSSAPSKSRPFSSTCLRQRNSERKVRPVYDELPQDKLSEIQDIAKTLPIRNVRADEADNVYTEEQLEALREATKAIDPRDLVTQARMRNDHWAPQTVEDFAYIDPQVDKDKAYAKLMREITSEAFIPKIIRRLKDARSTQELFAEAKKLNLKLEVKTFLTKLEDWIEKHPELFVEREAYVRDILHRYVTVPGTEEDGTLLEQFEQYNQAAEQLEGKKTAAEEDSLEVAGLKRVAAEIGFTVDQLRQFRTKELVFRRVVNQTRMGKIPSMYSLTVVGNRSGLIGIGEGKSSEMADAIRQAKLNALRNLKSIPLYENRTIFGKIMKKVGGTTVEITAKPPGFGIRCHHLVYEMCRCAGIHDLSARVGRSRNPMNTAKAFFEAITSQQLPDDIARSRGRKLVDLRKVYYDGNVY